MSYNLMAEGDLDLFELSQLARDYLAIELFPIPGAALGIAIPSSRANEATWHALHSLITQLLAKNATVHDLMVDQPVTADHLDELRRRFLGN